MKASDARIARFVAAGREPCAACGRGYRFRTTNKRARHWTCRYCEVKARMSPPPDLRAFLAGIRSGILSAGPFRRVIAANRRWNVHFSRPDGWKPTPPTARAA